MQVLLVKLTSMGDLIHLLPALTDAKQARPEIEFTWVADSAFAEVPTWSSSVVNVVKSSHRKWKRNFRKSWRNKEIQTFYQQLRVDKYDLVIDAQSSIKSAVISFLARGKTVGMDKASAREKLAASFYSKKIAIPKRQHAIARLRQLMAKALDYPLPDTPPDFAIKAVSNRPAIHLPKKYCVFVTNAAWPTKCYPEKYWHELLGYAAKDNLQVLLPWGSAAEHEVVNKLAQGHANAQVLPRLPLTDYIYIFNHAIGAICVDTGLAHLAGALNTPAITLYGTTDPDLIGTTGANQKHLQLNLSGTQYYARDFKTMGGKQAWLQAWAKLPPEKVWQQADELFKIARN